MASPATPPESLIAPPSGPPLSQNQRHEQALRSTRQHHTEHVERRRQLRGLLALAVIVLALSIARAGLDRVFPNGWWRLW